MPTMAGVFQWRGAEVLVMAIKAVTALLLTLALGGSLAVPASAAEPTAFTNAILQIYPEYDDSRLLVMLEGKIPQGTQTPVTVRFLVPEGAEMYAAGSLDASGKYTGGPPNRKASGIAGWDEISYNLTTETFRMEYYHDSIKGLPDKSIAYEFRTLYPIDSLAIELLQPTRASNFTASPASQSKGTVEGNLTVHRYTYRSVGVEKPLALSVSYSKPDSNPIKASPQTQSSSAAGAADGNPIWIVGIGGALVLAVGAIWYAGNRRRYRYSPRGSSRPSQRSTSSVSRGRVPASRISSAKTGDSRAGSRANQRAQSPLRREPPPSRPAPRGGFCRKCGMQLPGSVQFCKACGTRVG